MNLGWVWWDRFQLNYTSSHLLEKRASNLISGCSFMAFRTKSNQFKIQIVSIQFIN